jgi:type II secretory pathway pseudopilin PulG
MAGRVTPRAPGFARSAQAFTLIEVLVYMSMLAVLMGLGYAALYRSMDASTGLRRNASDITQALNTGERWRDDIRAATQPLRLEQISDAESLLHIPQPNAEVTYRFVSNSVSRRVGSGEWSPALEHVDHSVFISDPRQKVTAWKWEIELQSYHKSLTRLQPLFTVLAVPTNTPTK